MSTEHYEDLVEQLCAAVQIPDVDTVLARGSLEVDGFEVLLDRFDSDPDAMYLNFDYGVATAGRTLPIFQLMLEANLTVYAQDQAQLGLCPDTGCILLIVRIPFGPEVDGQALADTLAHYVEHGRYWKNNLVNSSDEMFDGLCSGNYLWIRA